MLRSGAHALTVATVVLLAGCSAHGAQTAAVSSGPTSATPTATRSIPAVALPSDCTRVVAPGVYAKELGSTPLNDPSFIAPNRANAVAPVTPPPGAGFAKRVADAVELRCVWRAPGTVTPSMTLTEAHVDVDAATSYLSRAKLLHWNCADAHGGRECQKAEQHGTSVAVLHTVFFRDGVFIEVTQSDFITNDIIGSIVSTLWP